MRKLYSDIIVSFGSEFYTILITELAMNRDIVCFRDCCGY